MSTKTVTKRLAALGLPVTMYRGDGYHYFIFYDTARNIYDCESHMVYRFRSLTVEHWVDIGKAFASKVESERN